MNGFGRSNPSAEQSLEAEVVLRRRSASADQVESEQRQGGTPILTKERRLRRGSNP
jgi:hypothetical protein